MKQLFALFLVAGCGVSNPGSGGGDDDHIPSPDPDVPQVLVPMTTAPYQMTSAVDITVEALLPEQAELVVSTLRDFSTNPARTLIDVADEAGVPAVGTLYALLPDVLTDRLEGWINDEIAKVQIDGKPVTAYAGLVAMLADTALTRFALDSELTVHGATATHRLTRLDLTPAGIAVQVPIGGLAGDLLTQEPDVAIVHTDLVLGEQHFGLNYGEYAWQGIDAVSRRAFGGGVRDVLGQAINCPNLAHNVAGKCVLSVCVGHEAELTEICEGGLDAIVGLVHDRLAAIRLEVLHLASGQATLIDDDHDGVADRLVDGTWQAELDLGVGLRHTPASFAAHR
ncbi:MAG TPA: hypothetical protein VFK02_08895 [Kofleriaceae bacterium]|nr:hypothetical protein [Kofleriaceae bacterium]